MCNVDGSLKNHTSATTFTIKGDPSKSLTVNNTVLYVSGTALVLVAACLVVLVVKRTAKKA